MKNTKYKIYQILKDIYKLIKKQYFYWSNYLYFKLNNVNFSKKYTINGLLSIKNKGRLTIKNNFRCNSGVKFNPIGGDIICRLIVHKKANLTIGENVGISNSTIVATNSIIIEDNVLIGGGCKIWDTDFHSIDPLIRKDNDNDIKSVPIKISSNAFIGAGTIILKGVVIGENSIIGAGSVVSKNIPKNQIWAGNPAKFIKAVK